METLWRTTHPPPPPADSGGSCEDGTGTNAIPEKDRVLLDYRKSGSIKTEEDHIMECVTVAKEKLFPRVKFVSEDVMKTKLAKRVADFLQVPQSMMKDDGYWMEVWNRKAGNACRIAIKKKRNDISVFIGRKFVGAYTSAVSFGAVRILLKNC